MNTKIEPAPQITVPEPRPGSAPRDVTRESPHAQGDHARLGAKPAQVPPDLAVAAAAVGTTTWGAAQRIGAGLSRAVDAGASRGATGLGAASRLAGPIGFAVGAVATPMNAGQIGHEQRPGESEAQWLRRTDPCYAAYSAAAEAHGASVNEQRQLREFVATTRAGARAISDVKSHCDPNDFKAFSSAAALRKAMNPAAGEHMHHLVGQTPKNVRAYGTNAIQNTRNVINLPAKLHIRVSAVDSLKLAANSPAEMNGFKSMREYNQTLPYEEQRARAIKTIERAMREPGMYDPKVADALRKLENNPSACLPETKQ